MKITNSILLLVFLTTLISCFAPKPVMRFKPEETQTTWDKGKEFVSYKRGDYEVHASYYGNNEKYVIFDIEIVNNKGVEFLVAPEQIKMYTGAFDNLTQAVKYSEIPINAIDPEMELLKIEMENSKAEAAQKNAQVAAVAIFAAAIPLAIVATSSDIKHNNENNSQTNISNTELVDAGVNIALGATAISDMNNESQIISLNDNKNTWETASLRKTTLSPGYSIRGLVYFPIPTLTARRVQFDVPTPSGVVTFKYNFLLYYPQ